MNDAEIAWFAGMYEGEGSAEVTYAKTVPGAARRVRLSISSTDRDVLATLEKLLGGTVIDKWQDNHFNSKPAWTWRISSMHQVEEAIQMMWPWLHERRRGQLQRLLDALALVPPPGSSGMTHCKNGHLQTPENQVPRREGDKHYRRCKECRDDNWKRAYERLKAKRAAEALLN